MFCTAVTNVAVGFIYICAIFFCEPNTTQSNTINKHPFPQRDLSLQQSSCFGPTPQTLRTPGLENAFFVT